MASKKEVMDEFQNHQTYLGSTIKEKINTINGKKESPTIIKKGDVFATFVGTKSRPCVITKVKKDGTIVAIPLTSTENVHNLLPYNSRFFGEGWFSNVYVISTEEFVRDNFIGVFDNIKSLNEGIKTLREFIKKNI